MPVIQPVILSGGSGTRLWPASRAMYPKQLLPLVGERTMLQETALRLDGKANVTDDLLVICNDTHRFLVAEQLQAIERTARIVLEPEGRNTAPAAALAALLALRDRKDGEAPLLLIMPADHVIEDRNAFLEAVATGEASAAEGNLVMFGIVPSCPHTGYGYIEADVRQGEAASIQSFVEKPDLKTAVTLLETNRFFWNSGIFLFRADTFIEELGNFEPAMVAACRKSIDDAACDADFVRPDGAAFRECPSNSIDYAVMERTGRGAVVPMTAGWSDVGSWAALHDVSPKDGDGNAISGDVIAHNCKSSYISGSSRLVTAIGLDNLIVVEDKDSVLVAHKDQSQDVKVLVERLRESDRRETRLHRRVMHPWGSDESVDDGEDFAVRRLVINPGGAVSRQKQSGRDEHWVVVRGTARVSRDEEEADLAVNSSMHVPAGVAYRIANRGDEPLYLIAVQCGDDPGDAPT